MKVVLISIGTRGDMEPFLAIGEILRDKGHQVICAFPEQFRQLAEDATLNFASLGTEYLALLESDLGKEAMGEGGSGTKKFTANIKLASQQTEINKALVYKQYEIIAKEKPERILYNANATYPVIWELDHRGKSILICAFPYLHYVKGHTHAAFHSNFGPFLNKLTYSMANFGTVMTVGITGRWLNLARKIPRRQIKNTLLSRKVIYTISPTLFSRPDYWPENLQVLGFHARRKTKNWQPDEKLIAFLAKHKDNGILLFTFGSMTNPDPEGKTHVILEILGRNKIPAIINIASGGLVKPPEFAAEQICFVSKIPYERIFSQVYGVIHHGGSGTTHLGLKNGCATMIIPHIIDQFAWNEIIVQVGAGPNGIQISKITEKNLEPKILDLVNNKSYKKKARQIASQMEKENFREEIYKSIMGEQL